jgi:hypothetical protein
MAVQTDLQATLTQDPTLLFRARFAKARVTVTGIAGEFAGVPMRVKLRLALPQLARDFIERREISVGFAQTLIGADVEAKAPTGVGSLDIVYEVRTGPDA